MFFKDAKRCDEKVEGAFRIRCIAAVASQRFYEPALTRHYASALANVANSDFQTAWF